MGLSLRVFVAGLVIATASLVATAQTKPDLNGVWKMNPTQSKFSKPDTTPREVILKLDLQGKRSMRRSR